MTRVNDAYNLMVDGRMNCAQTVLSSFCAEYGLDQSMALRLSQGFGGGMGRTGKTCGAVTGAYLVLGLAQHVSERNHRDSIDKTYALVNEFNRLFEAKHSSLICRELIGYDLNSLDALAAAREKKIFTTICPDLVKDTVSILETLLKQS